jgi:phosphoribosyl 1,2-cyclic phosphate phosphodiesterase
VRVEILGSGGAVTIPRPGCGCRVCVEAREKGVPYARTGPSVFVHGPDVLIDTPEES